MANAADRGSPTAFDTEERACGLSGDGLDRGIPKPVSPFCDGPLSFIEIRRRLSAFAAQWKDAKRENADAKLFWARFYECYGVRPESATIYEKAVNKLDGARGFIDSFIPGLLIVEHKSRGKSLDSAFAQATDYFLALPEGERPRFIITSDFARISGFTT